MAARKRDPTDAEPCCLQHVALLERERMRQDRVGEAMCLKHRQAFACSHQRLPLRDAQGSGREQHEPCKRPVVAQRDIACEHRALRETTEDDAIARYVQLALQDIEHRDQLAVRFSEPGRRAQHALAKATARRGLLQREHIDRPPRTAAKRAQLGRGQRRLREHEPHLARHREHALQCHQVITRGPVAVHQHDDWSVAATLAVGSARDPYLQIRPTFDAHARSIP